MRTKLFFLVVIFGSACGLTGMELKKEVLPMGLGERRIAYVDGTCVGLVSVSKGELAAHILELPEAMLAQVPAEVRSAYALLADLKTQGVDFKSCIILGDVYVKPTFRGKGYARQMIAGVCTEIFTDPAVGCIALDTDPFEYDGPGNAQRSLYADADYGVKKQRLEKLYTSCGFVRSITGASMLLTRAGATS